jgi:hypothetical protein
MREQGMFDPARLVFIDETSTSTNLVRLRGRCLRGVRLISQVPHGHWKTITFVAGLRYRAIVAPFVLDGAMNGTMFLAYVKQCQRVIVVAGLPVHHYRVEDTVAEPMRWCSW